MAASTVVKVRRDGTLKLQDGAGSPVTLTIDYEDGNFTANNLAEDSDRIIIRDRGTIVGLRKGDDQVGSIGFSVHMREFSNQGAATLLDFCNGTASGSALTSTGGSGFEPFLCTVMMEIEGTDHGDNADATCNFLKVLLTCDFSEGDPNVLNVQGEVYGGIQRSGQT